MTDTNKNSQTQMPLYFDDFITRESYLKNNDGFPVVMSVYPSTNLVETETHFLIEIAVPGIDPDAVDVLVKDNAIEVRYDASRPTFFSGKIKIWAEEYKKRSFKRRFKLNAEHVNFDTIEAIFEHGILYISVEKAASLKGKIIPIFSFSDN